VPGPFSPTTPIPIEDSTMPDLPLMTLIALAIAFAIEIAWLVHA
jgi:hypothetical protein